MIDLIDFINEQLNEAEETIKSEKDFIQAFFYFCTFNNKIILKPQFCLQA